MKKLISIALALLLVFSFAACGGQKEEPRNEAAGGYTVPEKLTDSELAGDIAAVFEEVCKNSGRTLTPAALLGTQVVAGTNYAFLCTENGKTSIAIIFEGLDGKKEISSVKELDITAYAGKDTEADNELLEGGFAVTEAVTANKIDEQAQKALDTALEGLVGMNYEAVALLGTKVVSGTNYAILCKGTPVTPDAVSALYIVTVYAGLDGKAEISSTAALNLADFTA